MATRRVAKVDIELRGHTIKAGEGIIAATQSASRDEDIFSEPEVFDILRFEKKENGGRGEDWHTAMGYGWGEHRCVAEPLARGELEIVFGKCDGPKSRYVVLIDVCSDVVPTTSESKTCGSV